MVLHTRKGHKLPPAEDNFQGIHQVFPEVGLNHGVGNIAEHEQQVAGSIHCIGDFLKPDSHSSSTDSQKRSPGDEVEQEQATEDSNEVFDLHGVDVLLLHITAAVENRLLEIQVVLEEASSEEESSQGRDHNDGEGNERMDRLHQDVDPVPIEQRGTAAHSRRPPVLSQEGVVEWGQTHQDI